MTQIASLLVVATVFTWLMVYSQGWGAYTRDKATYAGIWTGGVIVGYYGVRSSVTTLFQLVVI